MPITAYLQLIKPLLLNDDIHKTVQLLFLQYQWSPEQISFRLKHEKNLIQISYATIYRGIYRGFLEEGKLSPGQLGGARKLRHREKQDIKMVVLKREVKLKLVITFQNDQNKQINESEYAIGKLILLQA